jgi:hypothetical protein
LKRQRRTAAPRTCRKSWKICSTAKTKTQAMGHIYSCDLLARYGCPLI